MTKSSITMVVALCLAHAGLAQAPVDNEQQELQQALTNANQSAVDLIRELEAFLLELGTDFTFVARQKRITIDYEDFYLDLLFYHRRLRRLVAIGLKIGRFQAAYKGEMELYLRWLEKHETHEDERPPIGLILCAGKSQERVELLQLEAAGIRVAEYLTELPPRELLERKLHDAIRLARERLARQRQEKLPPPSLPAPQGPAIVPKRRRREAADN